MAEDKEPTDATENLPAAGATAAPETAEAPIANRPLPPVAALLSILNPGLGHVYAGAYRRALTIAALVLASLLVVALLVTSPARPTLTLSLAAVVIACLFVLPAVDAFRVARHKDRFATGARRRLLLCALFYLGLTAAGATEALVVRTFWAQAFRLPTPSTEPTLLRGDFVYVDKRAYRQREPRRGEIIVFHYPRDQRQDYVKRLVGLPGDTVEMRGNVLYVNGQRCTSDPLPAGASPERNIHAPVRRETMGAASYLVLDDPRRPVQDQEPLQVPAGFYYFLGDNRNNSADSRHWGCVARRLLIGPATHIYYSYDNEALRVRWQRIGRRLTVSQ